MPAELNRVETIFHRAAALPPADRPAFVAAACGGDDELLRRVGALVAAHAALEGPAPTGSFARSADESAGVVIAGKYKLVEEIGEGGMGTVWMAQQTDPVKRFVAVKLIKAGMDSRSVLARFEAERQALAMMEHPNIARVLDAGATPEGKPFFVMELVKGVPITKYCDEHRLTPRQRLELFIPVCQAIQHAHQKGVIHRDIKPSNVLIALYDDKPVPKVIDFGVAKAAGQPLTDRTLATGFGAVVGTPEYMSPEQASFNNLDIDTRSDVYALGVLLYELLAGSPPFARKELEAAGLIEILRVIREQEPAKPSTKLSSAAALPSLSANRGTEPAKLTRILRGELDWIVMKALEKDRNRRYDTANGFAADVQRYLCGEPVQAVPPSTGYRLRKWLRRNKVAVLVAGVVWLVTLTQVGFSTLQWMNAERARQNEIGARHRAEDLGAEADAQRVRAEANQKLAEYRAASVGVDAALQYVRTAGPREGLVRLAATLKGLPADAAALRQAVVTNMLMWGQQIAPPYPAVGGWTVGVLPDGRRALARPNRNWEVRDLVTGRKVAELTTADTALSGVGRGGTHDHQSFSGDGRWLATIQDPEAGEPPVRIWDSTTWKERARVPRTADLPHRVYLNRDGSRVATLSEAAPRRRDTSWAPKDPRVHLLDGVTGRAVARLEHPEKEIEVRGFSPSGDVLLTTSGRVARLWSAADGRLLHTLDKHPGSIEAACFSPSGAWLALAAGPRVHWWNVATGQPDGPPVEIGFEIHEYDGDELTRFEFTTENVLLVRVWNVHGGSFGRRVGGAVCVRGEARAHRIDAVGCDGTHALTDDGHVYALAPFRRLDPPPGRRFPPEARAAMGGRRFVLLGDHFFDLEAEKPLGPQADTPTDRYHPVAARGFGFTIAGPWHYPRAGSTMLVPAADIPLSDDVLELWARVIARGHLSPDTGLFAEDDEPTWDRNRRDLIGRAIDAGEFPFPGPFVNDRLYWLNQALNAEQTTEKQLPLVERLIAADPSWRSYARRAWVLNVLNRYPDAIRDDIRARELGQDEYEDNVPGLGAEASVRVVIGDPKGSRDAYELALRWLDLAHPRPLDPKQATSRALALYRLGRYDEALKELAPFEGPAVAEAAGAFLSPFALHAADEALLTAYRDFRRDPLSRAVEALCHVKLGQPAKAKRALELAREAAREVALENLRLRSDSWGESSVVGEAVELVGGLK